jgi:hypothetical protein
MGYKFKDVSTVNHKFVGMFFKRHRLCFRQECHSCNGFFLPFSDIHQASLFVFQSLHNLCVVMFATRRTLIPGVKVNLFVYVYQFGGQLLDLDID